jgi:two-component system, sensor histidine kinase and response regulator
MHGANQSLNVLLVEDLPANQAILAGILHGGGHRVAVAQDGQEAVQLAGRRQFDLVLMDLQMPRMDGLAATVAIRKFPRRTRVPIVAITARRTDGDRERCLAAGMNAFLTKPVDGEKLLELIAELTDRSPPKGRGGNHVPTTKQPNEHPDNSAAAPPSTNSEFDLTGTLQRLRGDRDLLAILIKMFSEDSPGWYDRLRAAAQAGQYAEAQHAAHSLRGLASNFGAATLIRSLQEIEHLASEKKSDKLLPLVERAGELRTQLQAALEPYA